MTQRNKHSGQFVRGANALVVRERGVYADALGLFREQDAYIVGPHTVIAIKACRSRYDAWRAAMAHYNTRVVPKILNGEI